jgi:2-polyprenyl-6-methoxyphenol hydroxylase-like FAD-dependent oxidoreductase
MSNKGSAIIVGGSLTALALAIALAKVGVVVRVIEQNEGRNRLGTGLGVDRPLLSLVSGVDATRSGEVPALPVVQYGARSYFLPNAFARRIQLALV